MMYGRWFMGRLRGSGEAPAKKRLDAEKVVTSVRFDARIMAEGGERV
jgi:hypothetical protein